MGQLYNNPSSYWQERLSRDFALTGAGYNGLGPRYNQIMYQRRLEVLSRMLAAVSCEPQSKSVLEVGCGTGFYTAWFKQKGVASYTGLDITQVSVERLKARFPEFQFVQADIASDDVSIAGQFDIVMVADVMFHIVDDIRFRAALANIARLLKPGGRLILSDIFPGTTYQSAPHVRYRSLDEYRAILAANHLHTLDVQLVFSVLHPPPYVPTAAWQWKLYSWVWQYGLYRLGKLTLFDRVAPGILAMIDNRLALRHTSITAPNTKWLIAARTNGS